MKNNIPKRIIKFMKKLKENGFEAYLVGGCVRDFFLNKEPNDYDVATNASVEDILKIFKKFHILNKKNIKHNTVFVMFYDMLIEVTSYRCIEEYTISGDLMMRDITINAMAYDGEFIDPLNGKMDIENKVIRACDLDSFAEDPIRLLRAIRFASTLGFEIEEKTKELIKQHYSSLTKIGKQRIGLELFRIFKGDYIYNVMMEYWEVFCLIIPELSSTIKYDKNNKEIDLTLYEKLVKAINNIKEDYVTRLAVLILESVNCSYFMYEKKSERMVLERYNICKDFLIKFNFDVKDREEILFLIENIDKRISYRKDIIKLIARTPEGSVNLVMRLIDFKLALNRKIKNYDRVINIIEEIKNEQHFILKDLNVGMRELCGFQLDKVRAKKLQYMILDLVIDGKVENKKKKILKYIKENLINLAFQ